MIRIKQIFGQGGKLSGFVIKGHAGYDEYGKDIICSAVSALSLNTINAIEKFTNDKFKTSQDADSGMLEFEIIGVVSPESRLLLDTLMLGLTDLQNVYGKEYVTITNFQGGV